jgi:Holliday junction resolvasome RuvABC DNA-binding subunit
MISKLHAAGLKNVQDVLDQGEDGLLQIKGIGEKTAKRIWALVQEREEKGGEAKAGETVEVVEETAATEEIESTPPDGAQAELAHEENGSADEQPTTPAATPEVLETAENTEENQN